jgi:hypothetical protein
MPARCGYTLRVTSQESYSPEYITPTHQISRKCMVKQIFLGWRLTSLGEVAFKVAFKEFLGKPRNSRAFVKEF